MVDNTGNNGSSNIGKRPLEGIRMLEYAIFHAGPGAGAIMGDLGADVIKIESSQGDPVRIWSQVGALNFAVSSGQSIMFDIANRNKRGISIDIKTNEGREIFHRLVKNTDVFLTNLRKSTKQKLGVDYETLSQVNPLLIHANVSGYGPEGPFADLGAFDPMGQARSGMMFATGTGEPTLMHFAALDQATAIAASHQILTALLVKERWGIGQEVHVSLYSTAMWILYANLMLASQLNIDGVLPWDRPTNSPLRNNFQCDDGGWIMGVHHPQDRYWEPLCKATNQEALINDPRFDTEEKRTENCPALVAIFDQVFLTKTRNEWMQLLPTHGLMFCPVQTPSEVLQDQQALENNYIVDFDHPSHGPMKIPGYPIHFSKTPAGTKSAAPEMGQHTDEILTEAGYTMSDIEEFRKQSVIR